MQKVQIKLIDVDRRVAKEQQNKMAAAVGGFGESKDILIYAQLEKFNENDKYILNQSTRNWTFGQHKRGLTKLLKATNRGFSYATVHKEGSLKELRHDILTRFLRRAKLTINVSETIKY